jgi:hypothetical protein
MGEQNTINPTQRLTPTGHKGYYSITIEGPNQYKSTVSAFTIEFQHTLKLKQLSWVPH